MNSIQNHTPELFNIDDKYLDHLELHGYAVIKDILTPLERINYYLKFMKEFKSVSPNFDFSDKTTWTNQNLPIMLNKGMVMYNGLAHGNSIWSLRTNKNIQSIFKNIHKTDELITSFDGYSMFLKKEQKSKAWLHIDQNPKNTIYSVQGAYNYFDVKTNDSGFICVPKSHKTFKPKNITHNKDWIPLTDEDTYEGSLVKLMLPKNCFVIWDSKLIHANVGMTPQKPNINRLTTYITMFPKSMQTLENNKKRIEAYRNGKACSHWPNKCEIKKYPYGFKANYEKKNFNDLVIKKHIPENRLELF